jgi:tRNA(adenine34) deaminase
MHRDPMRVTLGLAAWALEQGELPIAAQVVLDGGDQIAVIAWATTAERRQECRLVHAELLALEAADRLRPFPGRRGDAVLYTNLEPCPMCLCAAMSFGIGTVCYALESPSDGAVALFRGWRRDEEEMPGYRLPEIHGPETLGAALRDESIALFRRYADAQPPGPLRDWALTLARLRA